jgi:glucose-6-phosphate 1-epimerase
MPFTSQIDHQSHRFAIPGLAKIVAGNGNLPKIQITSPAAAAEIYLHGAQLTSWQPAGQEEVIFLSQQSRWEDGKAIRGGIPVCFPWFRAKTDNPKAPAHGFARTKSWELDAITQEANSIVVTLSTQTDEQSRQWWPYECRITLRISIGSELKLDLTVTNTGTESFHFEEALHAYNRVGDIHSIQIAGLDGIAYLDNREANKQKLQTGKVQLTQATDNAYLNAQSPVEIPVDILDPALKRRIRLEKQNSQTTVVWNPWHEDAAKLADLGNDEWQEFACVEASNILSSPVTLAPGQQHTMTALIRVSAETN